MGGPTDEEPPKWISSIPADQSTSIKPEKIVLTFDEFVGLENPAKGVVITPKINKDLVEFTALKNTITVLLSKNWRIVPPTYLTFKNQWWTFPSEIQQKN